MERLSKHPNCEGPVYRGGLNYPEQITDILGKCHLCHQAYYRGRHRILVECGHVMCDDCFNSLLKKNVFEENNFYERENENQFLSSNCSEHSNIKKNYKDTNEYKFQELVAKAENLITLICPLCHVTQQFPARRLKKIVTSTSTELMADRLLRRHNSASGDIRTFYDIKSYFEDPLGKEATF